MCDSSIERIKAFENDKSEYDLVYIGRKSRAKEDFINRVKEMKEVNVKLFGDSENRRVFGQEYFDILNRAKMALSYNVSNDTPMSFSDRMLQLTGCGVATLSPRVPKIELLFSEDEIIFFDSFEELEDKAKFYAKNDKQRIKIAQNGWKRAHNSYNSTRVAKYLIEAIYDKKYSEDYEWLEE
jgi:glycosyltransferase involved in cell wall biosynthesis